MASTFTILQEGYVPSKPHINIHLEDGNYGTGMDGFFIIATAEKPVNSNLTIKGTVYADGGHLEEEISQNFTLYINKSSTTGNTHVFNDTPDIWLNYMSDLSVTPSEDSLYFYAVDW